MRMLASEDRAFLIAVGRRIRTLRMERGLSQEKLALRSGIHRTYISSVERGQRNIALLNLKRLARTLRVSLPDLMDIDRPR